MGSAAAAALRFILHIEKRGGKFERGLNYGFYAAFVTTLLTACEHEKLVHGTHTHTLVSITASQFPEPIYGHTHTLPQGEWYLNATVVVQKEIKCSWGFGESVVTRHTHPLKRHQHTGDELPPPPPPPPPPPFS